jgi:hypothetical protein
MKTPSIYSFALLLIAALLFSCKADETDIGSDLIPGEDQLGMYTYEADVRCKTVREDSFPVFLKGTSLPALLLGSYVDPIFGKVQANFAAQFAPSKASFTFGDAAVIDSVILSLEYTGSKPFYGDISKWKGAQRFKVYELNEDILADTVTTYYSNHNVQYKPTLLGEKSVIPNNTSGFTWKKDTLVTTENPQLRIKLNDNAKSVFQNATAANLVDGTSWYNYFRGLYVVADNGAFQKTGEGAILRFDVASLTNTKCRIRVFYHNSTNNAENPFDFFDFYANSATRKLNIYQHNYKNTQLEQDMKYGGYNAYRVYIQGLGGVKTKVELPDFQLLPEFSDTAATYVINKAELIIPVDESGYSYTYPLADNLIVVMPDTAAKYAALENAPNANIRDLTDVSQFFYGGAYNSDAKEYKFRISLHISDLINRRLKQNKGLYIVSGLGGYLADRVVLSNSANRKVRLRIIYTKI